MGIGDMHHPLQQAIRRAVSQECGLRADRVLIGTDGCGVPSFAVPVRSAARAFARLANPDSVKGPRSETLTRIRDAMTSKPFFVAGTDRLDTDFMNASGTIKGKPTSWKEMFFPEVHDLSGD